MTDLVSAMIDYQQIQEDDTNSILVMDTNYNFILYTYNENIINRRIQQIQQSKQDINDYYYNIDTNVQNNQSFQYWDKESLEFQKIPEEYFQKISRIKIVKIVAYDIQNELIYVNKDGRLAKYKNNSFKHTCGNGIAYYNSNSQQIQGINPLKDLDLNQIQNQNLQKIFLSDGSDLGQININFIDNVLKCQDQDKEYVFFTGNNLYWDFKYISQYVQNCQQTQLTGYIINPGQNQSWSYFDMSDVANFDLQIINRNMIEIGTKKIKNPNIISEIPNEQLLQQFIQQIYINTGTKFLHRLNINNINETLTINDEFSQSNELKKFKINKRMKSVHPCEEGAMFFDNEDKVFQSVDIGRSLFIDISFQTEQQTYFIFFNGNNMQFRLQEDFQVVKKQGQGALFYDPQNQELDIINKANFVQKLNVGSLDKYSVCQQNDKMLCYDKQSKKFILRAQPFTILDNIDEQYQMQQLHYTNKTQQTIETKNDVVKLISVDQNLANNNLTFLISQKKDISTIFDNISFNPSDYDICHIGGDGVQSGIKFPRLQNDKFTFFFDEEQNSSLFFQDVQSAQYLSISGSSQGPSAVSISSSEKFKDNIQYKTYKNKDYFSIIGDFVQIFEFSYKYDITDQLVLENINDKRIQSEYHKKHQVQQGFIIEEMKGLLNNLIEQDRYLKEQIQKELNGTVWEKDHKKHCKICNNSFKDEQKKNLTEQQKKTFDGVMEVLYGTPAQTISNFDHQLCAKKNGWTNTQGTYDYVEYKKYLWYKKPPYIDIGFNMHIGQRKLLYSEILFLTTVFQKIGINKKVLCVYVGSAAGYHLPYNVKMFPNTQWILIDPNHFFLIRDEKQQHYSFVEGKFMDMKQIYKHKVKNDVYRNNTPTMRHFGRDFTWQYFGSFVEAQPQKINSKNHFTIINSYMVDGYLDQLLEIINLFQHDFLCFISDIRIEDSDNQVVKETNMQEYWGYYLKANFGFLKFRTFFEDENEKQCNKTRQKFFKKIGIEKTEKYPIQKQSIIFAQIYTDLRSTESRMYIEYNETPETVPLNHVQYEVFMHNFSTHRYREMQGMLFDDYCAQCILKWYSKIFNKNFDGCREDDRKYRHMTYYHKTLKNKQK